MLFSKGVNSFQALLFGVNTESLCFKVGDTLDLAVAVEVNHFRGEDSVSVQIKGIRMSDTDDDKLFREIAEFNSYKSGRDYDLTVLFPTREEVGTVFKAVSNEAMLPDRIRYIFIKDLGYAKTAVAINVAKGTNSEMRSQGAPFVAVSYLS